MEYMDSDVVVRASPIEGLGVFARRDFSPDDSVRRVCVAREITDEAPLDPDGGECAEHCARVDGRVLLLDVPDRFVNHSCDPNAYYVYDRDGSSLHARRPIASGEEVCVDYLVNNGGGDSWACSCGAARCRGQTGTSFFALPKASRKEYLPLLAPWFRRRHAARLLDTDWS